MLEIIRDLILLCLLSVTTQIAYIILVIKGIWNGLLCLFKSTPSVPIKCVLITGGSSGIGKALCLYYSKKGALVAFTGRNPKRVANVKKECEKNGAKVLAKVLDVTNKQGMKDFIEEIENVQPIDLVIANAGIYKVNNHGLNDEEKIGETFNINAVGTLNTVLPVLTKMKERRRGKVLLMSSLSALLPHALGMYSVSKATILNLANMLQLEYSPYGIHVAAACPGYVDTPMYADTKISNFLTKYSILTPEKAVEKIVYGLEKNHSMIAFPFLLHAMMYCLSALPFSVSSMVVHNEPKAKKIPKKEKDD